MKPEIDTKVYCIYGEGIFFDFVGFLGSESFIVDSIGEATYPDSWEWRYEDYGKEWFTDLEDAGKELLSRLKEEYGDSLRDNLELVQVCEGWYEYECEDED